MTDVYVATYDLEGKECTDTDVHIVGVYTSLEAAQGATQALFGEALVWDSSNPPTTPCYWLGRVKITKSVWAFESGADAVWLGIHRIEIDAAPKPRLTSVVLNEALNRFFEEHTPQSIWRMADAQQKDAGGE